MSENKQDDKDLKKIIDETDIVEEVILPAGWDGYDNDDTQAQVRINKNKKKKPSISKNTVKLSTINLKKKEKR